MGHKLKTKCVDSRGNAHDLASTGVPFTLTTVQVLNLALTYKKRITVQCMLKLLSPFRLCQFAKMPESCENRTTFFLIQRRKHDQHLA
jgi:hypothetical protein